MISAIMCRSPSRTSHAGRQPMIEEAELHLAHAARAGRIGPFQLEAAIQSAHAQRAVDRRDRLAGDIAAL